MVHISEIAYKRVTNIADEISVGQEVTAKILEIDKERKRISLSIKETLDPPSAQDEEEPVAAAAFVEETEAAPVEEPAAEVSETAAEEPVAEATEEVEAAAEEAPAETEDQE